MSKDLGFARRNEANLSKANIWDICQKILATVLHSVCKKHQEEKDYNLTSFSNNSIKRLVKIDIL